MQYIIGKSTAAEFCEKFEETIRNYENSPGATLLSEDEKRDAFYNAVMVSVPSIQTVEFVSKNTKGKSVNYEELKLLVLQDEANRWQSNDGLRETRAAFSVKRDNIRCYECHTYMAI